jgi:cysteine-rich repeat protein
MRPKIQWQVYDICGNDYKTGNEVCEDGNTVDGDGCSADCSTEDLVYFTKTTDGNGKSTYTPKHGDGYRIGNEECDDGNTVNTDGCSNSGTINNGWTCTEISGGDVCICATNYYLHEGTCITTCPDGTYGDSNTNKCETCHTACLKCTAAGVGSCQACNEAGGYSFDGQSGCALCGDG